MNRHLVGKPSGTRLLATAFFLAGIINSSLALGECRLLLLAQLGVTVSSNRPLIDGEINGHKIKILVDTGSEYTMIWRSAAVHLGLPLEDVRGLRMFGVGGETHLQAAKTREFKLAEFGTHGVRFLVAGEGENNSFDMILGEDFLSKVTAEFDLAHGAMRLFRPEGCKTEQLMYWSPTYSSATLESPPSHAHRIDTAVEINGKRVIATLDSGATHSIISTGAAENAGMAAQEPEGKGEGRVRGIGGRSLEFTVVRFDSIAIGDEKVQNLRLQVGNIGRNMRVDVTGSHLGEALKGAPHMLIGADFFVSHRIIIPADGPVILFTYAGGPVFQVMHNVAAAAAADSRSTGTQPAAATESKPDGGAP
jgi:predicted aspartyl protease